MKIIAISGSLRKASFNTKLLELVKAQASGHDVEIVSIADIPLYNGDVEEAGMPAPVLALSEKIRSADAVYFATPEYNYGTSGVLKNTIDWLSRDREPSMPLGGKVVALAGTSAGMLGTANAQAHLRHTLNGKTRENARLGAIRSVFSASHEMRGLPHTGAECFR